MIARMCVVNGEVLWEVGRKEVCLCICGAVVVMYAMMLGGLEQGTGKGTRHPARQYGGITVCREDVIAELLSVSELRVPVDRGADETERLSLSLGEDVQ